jgi:hypothetical protein
MEHDYHMPESKTEVCPPPSKRPAAQLRRIGLIVLLAGFAIAGMIYAFAPEDTSSEDNPLLTEYYDKQEVAVQRMWGREGSLTLELTRSLRCASTYSVIVIVASVLGSFACFYLARDAYDDKDEKQVKLLPQPSETIKKPVGAGPTKSDHEA